MIGSKKIACIIPARLQSTRFPKKCLSILNGKPMLQWVWERARQVALFDYVTFAIDSHETAELIHNFNGTYVMTSVNCPSGTDRLVELMHKQVIDADIWVNWQGDEPFIHAEMINDLLQTVDHPEVDVWTLKKKLSKLEEIHSPHVTKVVSDAQGFALYFSRSVIPHYRDCAPGEHKLFFKHVGMYAFTQSALQKISTLKPCELEMAEQLEQLRFLYHNLTIQVHETQHEVFGIDLPEHIARAERLMDSHPCIPKQL